MDSRNVLLWMIVLLEIFVVNSKKDYPKVLLLIILNCTCISRQCVSMETSVSSQHSIKSKKVIVHKMCLLENQSVAATSMNRNTEVTIKIVKCEPFERCVDANTVISGQNYGYDI